MNDKISQIEKEKQEYEEYVESFAHEIKIPIGALSLTFDNTKNYALKKKPTNSIALQNRCFIMREAKVQKKIIL